MEELETRQGIIIPAIITFINMFFGLGAIFIAMSKDLGSLRLASSLILLAALTDKLDGYVARKLGVTSEFGRELDSLCDLVSFGIAPMVLIYSLDRNLSLLQIVIIAFYVGGGIYRLARFNIGGEADYIVGLPITMAGALIALKCILDIDLRIRPYTSLKLLRENLFLVLSLGILMVGNFRLRKPNFIIKDLF